MAKDLYEILGLTRETFNDKDCKKNYKKLSLKYHPDKFVGKSEEEQKEATEKFKEITHAYDVLSDPEKRRNYDMFGDENASGDVGGFNPFSGGGFNPFGDVFNGFNPFGRANQRQSQRLQPGEDVQMNIPVTIEDLFNGLSKTVKYKIKVRCVSCHGKGGSGQKTCPKCNGAGYIVTQHKSGMGWTQIQQTTCPHCGGSGFIVENKCSRCGGSGFEDKEVTLDISFDPGIANGQPNIYYGKGYEAKDHRAENGNFIAVAKYKIDEDKYIIDGLNVLEHVYIPYYDALLGCNYTVNIPNGKVKSVKIKPCTTDSTVLKFSKEGIKDKVGHQGDYFICIHYEIPETLSSIEKAHLEEIKRANS